MTPEPPSLPPTEPPPSGIKIHNWPDAKHPIDDETDFTGLLDPGFGLEHVEQITGNINEVEVWSLFDQPTTMPTLPGT